MRNALYDLGLSQRAGARAIGIDPRMMRYYCAGEYEPPLTVWLALECLGNRFLLEQLQSRPAGERAPAPGGAAPVADQAPGAAGEPALPGN
jgi:hypothetical protein